MKKIAALLVIATIACGAMVCQHDQETIVTRNEPKDPESISPELAQRLAAHDGFRVVLENTLQSLERGDISLADAARRVHDAGQAWPVYLTDLETTEIGEAPLERIARNLIGHLENRSLLNPDVSRRLMTLQAELPVLVSESKNAS
jgi:hypothetical protein